MGRSAQRHSISDCGSPGIAVAVSCACATLIGCERAPTGPAPLNVNLVISEPGTSPGQLVYPRVLDFDSTGRLWAIDKTARVQAFDPASGEQRSMWTMPRYQLGKPTGMTFAPDRLGEEVLYVADTHYHRVMVYHPPDPHQAGEIDGAELLETEFGQYGFEDGQFVYPTDIAVLTGESGLAERIYVSEYGGNDRITVWSPDHEFLFAIGSPGDSPDRVEFARPQSIAIDAERRELIVTDSSNHRVGRLTLDGELIAWHGSFGEELGQFKYPYGLELLGDGTALICEFGNHRVQRIDLQSGESLGVYGEPGRREGQLKNPWAVATLGSSTFVLDSGNNRIMRIRTPGS